MAVLPGGCVRKQPGAQSIQLSHPLWLGSFEYRAISLNDAGLVIDDKNVDRLDLWRRRLMGRRWNMVLHYLESAGTSGHGDAESICTILSNQA